jgi:hypothetical protein
MDGSEAARWMLDRLEVRARLEHIRDYLWRGGEVSFEAQPASVAYVLAATWDTAVLEPAESMTWTEPGLLAASTPVVDGCWRRRRTGYSLRVGIDVRVLTAISITTPLVRSYVPFVGRSAEEIAEALDARLAEYGQVFLDLCLPVPQAIAAAEARLREHRL